MVYIRWTLQCRAVNTSGNPGPRFVRVLAKFLRTFNAFRVAFHETLMTRTSGCAPVCCALGTRARLPSELRLRGHEEGFAPRRKITRGAPVRRPRRSTVWQQDEGRKIGWHLSTSGTRGRRAPVYIIKGSRAYVHGRTLSAADRSPLLARFAYAYPHRSPPRRCSGQKPSAFFVRPYEIIHRSQPIRLRAPKRVRPMSDALVVYTCPAERRTRTRGWRSRPYLEIFFERAPKHVYCNFIEFRF
jgi:hypothetical protein